MLGRCKKMGPVVLRASNWLYRSHFGQGSRLSESSCSDDKDAPRENLGSSIPKYGRQIPVRNDLSMLRSDEWKLTLDAYKHMVSQLDMNVNEKKNICAKLNNFCEGLIAMPSKSTLVTAYSDSGILVTGHTTFVGDSVGVGDILRSIVVVGPGWGGIANRLDGDTSVLRRAMHLDAFHLVHAEESE